MKNTKNKTKAVAKPTRAKAKTKKANTNTTGTLSYVVYDKIDFRARVFLFKWYAEKALKALFLGRAVL